MGEGLQVPPLWKYFISYSDIEKDMISSLGGFSKDSFQVKPLLQ